MKRTLINTCKELNIGMSTAVEFCKKHGKVIETDPNARITDEMYLLLAKEFNKDIMNIILALKLEAERRREGLFSEKKTEQSYETTSDVKSPKQIVEGKYQILIQQLEAAKEAVSQYNAKNTKLANLQTDFANEFAHQIESVEQLMNQTINGMVWDNLVIAFFGETNAGKSTTMNTILKYSKSKNEKEVMSKDMLFATLGTSVRNVKLPNNQEILLIDTVGFVSKLPTLLVNSFRSTLEEIINSSLIIHVVDVSTPYYNNQVQVTKEVLAEIGVNDIKEVYLLNKYDKCESHITFFEGKSLTFSNKTEHNHDKLLELIQNEVLEHSNTLLSVNIPLSDGKAVALIESSAIIQARIYSSEYIYYKAYIPNVLINQIKNYII